MRVENVSGVPSEATSAIREFRSVPEIQLSALSVFTQAMVSKRGLPDRTEVEAFLSAGYKETDILEIIHAIAIKTISNYTNHIFHTEVDDAFAKHTWNDPRNTDNSTNLQAAAG